MVQGKILIMLVNQYLALSPLDSLGRFFVAHSHLQSLDKAGRTFEYNISDGNLEILPSLRVYIAQGL